MRYWKIIAAIAAAVVATVFVVVQTQHGFAVMRPSAAAAPEKPADPPLPTPVAAAVVRTIPLYLDYSARTESIRSIALQPKASGYIQAQAAVDGADVAEGALLYRIDPRDYQAALNQAEAQAQKSAASLAYARANLNRATRLTQSGFLSKDGFDQSASTAKQGEAAVAADAAAVQAARINLGYTQIRAPFAGRLGRNQAPAGTLVTPGGSPLNTLVQISPLYVTFTPSEIDLATIRAAQKVGAVEVEVRTRGQDAPVKGQLTFVDNTVDRATGAILARAVIANADRALLPGQYVGVRVLIGQRPNTILVPQIAVGSNQQGKFVYVVERGDKVGQRPVELGPIQGELVAVTKGLTPSDRIITGNLQKLSPGAAVKPVFHVLQASTPSEPQESPA